MIPPKKLKKFFNKLVHPEPLTLDSCTTILDVKKFTDSHLAVLDSNTGNKTFMPYYERLVKLYNLLNPKK